MSTIKSSDEHLTLNADGSSKDIKFQANGVEKASISSSGAFTSTTIDATKLTGALPAIDGSNLTGITTMAAGGTMTGDLLIHKQNPAITLKPNGANNAMKLMFKDENDDVKFTLGYQDSVSAFRLSSTDINATDYIHVDTSGRVLIGTTNTGSVNPNGMHIRASSYGGYALQVVHTAGTGDGHGILVDIPNYTGSGGQYMLRFYTNGGETGSIKSTQSSTAYNTSSDYRLKENVDYDWDATTRLKQLKPARFNFIADETNTLVDGFIAHEVSSVVPEAISGEKDAMTTNENGDAIIDPQGIDQSKLVPLLVKTIQELEARITALES